APHPAVPPNHWSKGSPQSSVPTVPAEHCAAPAGHSAALCEPGHPAPPGGAAACWRGCVLNATAASDRLQSRRPRGAPAAILGPPPVCINSTLPSVPAALDHPYRLTPASDGRGETPRHVLPAAALFYRAVHIGSHPLLPGGEHEYILPPQA